MESTKILIGRATVAPVVLLASIIAALIVIFGAMLMVHVVARAREDRRAREAAEAAAERRHAEQLAQWQAARDVMGAYTAQIAHAAVAMVDVSKAIRDNSTSLSAAIRDILAPESSLKFSDEMPPAAQRGSGIDARGPVDTISDLPPIPPYDPAVSDHPTLRSIPHPPEPTG